MSVFKQILVPVDYSGRAESALHHARLFMVAFNARVDVLHVWRPPVTVPPEPGEHYIMTYPPGENAESLARREAEVLIDKLFARADLKDEPRFRKVTEAGSPTRVILKRAEAYDLVIMATRGRTGLSRVVLGSVAEKVVRHASCPVLVVHGS